MRTFLAMAIVLPMMMCGCSGGGGVPALDKAGVDPPAETQKNWMEESRKRGGPPKNLKTPKPDDKKPEEKKTEAKK